MDTVVLSGTIIAGRQHLLRFGTEAGEYILSGPQALVDKLRHSRNVTLQLRVRLWSHANGDILEVLEDEQDAI